MKVTLDYGRTGLTVTLPVDRLIAPPLELRPVVSMSEPSNSIRQAIQSPIGTLPLSELALGKRSACILICDITRPVPNQLILPIILDTIEAAGVPRQGITILIATGLHRPNLGSELIELVGEEIASQYYCVNHDGKNINEHDYLGCSDHGVPIWIDRRYTRAELKIATGLIEPHFMAGYSGGRKLICPGIAGFETIKAWHSPKFLEDSRATTGVIDGNPVHEENTKIALKAGCDFIVNVCLDGDRQITWVGAGDMIQAWQDGVAFCRRSAQATVPELCDIVVTSSAGYPLDTTFYQAVKGMVGALPIVKPGGTIIIAASLTEGLGSPEFQSLMKDNQNLNEFLRRILQEDYFVMDQWQLEKLAHVIQRCKVKMVSHGISADILKNCYVEPVSTVESALEDSLDEYGPHAKIAVIPKGPYVIANIAQ